MFCSLQVDQAAEEQKWLTAAIVSSPRGTSPGRLE
jgi:hypothetical protein